jgi:hypothetical protein
MEGEMNKAINKKLAAKVLSVIDAGLVSGLGTPEPGKMCIEAAVNYALGAPHGDKPACVSPALRDLKINLNDANWSTNAARTKGLRRLGIAQLGSAGVLDEREFTTRVARFAIRTCVPQALRSAASVAVNDAHKAKLLAHADKCESEPTEANARETEANAREADAAAARAAANAASAARAAADAAAAAAYAAYAANAAASAANAAAYAASAAYAAAYAASNANANAAAAAANARDTSLADFCEGVVQILIEMDAPGCEWLFLTEAA